MNRGQGYIQRIPSTSREAQHSNRSAPLSVRNDSLGSRYRARVYLLKSPMKRRPPHGEIHMLDRTFANQTTRSRNGFSIDGLDCGDGGMHWMQWNVRTRLISFQSFFHGRGSGGRILRRLGTNCNVLRALLPTSPNMPGSWCLVYTSYTPLKVFCRSRFQGMPLFLSVFVASPDGDAENGCQGHVP